MQTRNAGFTTVCGVKSATKYDCSAQAVNTAGVGEGRNGTVYTQLRGKLGYSLHGFAMKMFISFLKLGAVTENFILPQYLCQVFGVGDPHHVLYIVLDDGSSQLYVKSLRLSLLISNFH